jgi:hypothetical protein
MDKLRPMNAAGQIKPDLPALTAVAAQDEFDEVTDSPREGWRDLLTRKKLQKKVLLDQRHAAASTIQVRELGLKIHLCVSSWSLESLVP